MNAAIDFEHAPYHECEFIQEALSRPLVFGDPKQIRALRLVEPPPLAEGKEKRFKVTVEFSGEFTEYVDANSKDEAIEQVMANMNEYPDECDVDITATEVP